MCGRIVTPEERAIENFWLIRRPDMGERMRPPEGARYNVAPQQNNPRNYIPVVRVNAAGGKELVRMQWWLLPMWANARVITYSTFNARLERVRQAPAFRESLKLQRCVVPALGWYEWQELPGGNKPWFLHGREKEMLNFAGLWARWTDGIEVVESCALIVGPANTAFEGVHDRMPFILGREDAVAWMDPNQTDPDKALALLRPNPDDAVVWHRVSRRVNHAANQGEELIRPITPEELGAEEAAPAKPPKAARLPKKPKPPSEPPPQGDLPF